MAGTTDSDAEFFSTIPWVASLLVQPTNVPFTPTCRQPPNPANPYATKDLFFRKSLNNADIIPHVIAFYEDPFSNRNAQEDSDEKGTRLLVKKGALICDLQAGTKGYHGSAHGGLIGTMIDEAMGAFIHVNYQVYTRVKSSAPDRIPMSALDMHGLAMVTANMNFHFKAPLPVPSIVLVEVKFNKIEGRKIFFDVEVRGEKGVVYATCLAMWVVLPVPKL